MEVLPVLDAERPLFEGPLRPRFSLLWYGHIDSYLRGTIKDSMRVEPGDYKENLVQLVRAVQRATPEGTCLFLLSPAAPRPALMKKDWEGHFMEYNETFHKFRSVEGTEPYRDAAEQAVEILQRGGARGLVFLDAFRWTARALADQD